MYINEICSGGVGLAAEDAGHQFEPFHPYHDHGLRVGA
jgi:hypothetical protein